MFETERFFRPASALRSRMQGVVDKRDTVTLHSSRWVFPWPWGWRRKLGKRRGAALSLLEVDAGGPLQQPERCPASRHGAPPGRGFLTAGGATDADLWTRRVQRRFRRTRSRPPAPHSSRRRAPVAPKASSMSEPWASSVGFARFSDRLAARRLPEFDIRGPSGAHPQVDHKPQAQYAVDGRRCPAGSVCRVQAAPLALCAARAGPHAFRRRRGSPAGAGRVPRGRLVPHKRGSALVRLASTSAVPSPPKALGV